MAKITTIEGIGAAYAEKLTAAGITTTEALLEHGAAASGRKEIAEKSGLSEKVILRWVNMCDLFRIKGVGEEYSDLLEAAGVDSVPELAQRNADNLTEKMATVNEEKKLVRQVPVAKVVEGWIAQAKELPKVVTH
jgi:predicted flap endonuclease-1-like 5' DNA nuclease